MRLMYYPYTIQIELVQGCNRQCSFCGTQGIESKVHLCSKSTLRHICGLIKDCKSMGTPRIALIGHGEPTLHPKLCEAISLIREYLPKNTIHLMSNGVEILSHPEIISEMFAAGLNDLIIDEYSDSRIGTLLAKHNILDNFNTKHLEEKGVTLFAPKNSATRRVLIVPPVDEKQVKSCRKFVNQCGAGMPPLKTPIQKKCARVFRELVFRWDGKVALCCNDFRGQYPVVDALLCKTLEEVWLHERFEAARRVLYTGDRTFYPCNVCNALPIREGLLPDSLGKSEMPSPTNKDYCLINKQYKALAVLRKRPWEK